MSLPARRWSCKLLQVKFLEMVAKVSEEAITAVLETLRDRAQRELAGLTIGELFSSLVSSEPATLVHIIKLALGAGFVTEKSQVFELAGCQPDPDSK